MHKVGYRVCQVPLQTKNGQTVYLVHMIIAVTARALGGRLEGIGHYTHELLSAMIPMSPDIQWHLIYDQRNGRRFVKASNVTNHFIGPRTRHPLLIAYWLDHRLPKILSKIKPDVIWYPDGLISLKVEIPSVQSVHDLAYLQYPEGSRRRDLKYYRKHMPRYVKKADQIITISNFTKDAILSNYNIEGNKIDVIYNGVATEFQPISVSEKVATQQKYSSGKPYLLYLGAIHPRKNVISVIRAYEEVRKQGHDYKLVLAGRMAWLSGDISTAINRSSYCQDIIRLEEIDTIIHAIVGAADMLCFMSLAEGFGLPVAEAMACGVPVITSSDSAMAEIGGDALLSCAPMDVSAIATNMCRIIEDSQLRDELRTSGLKKVKSYRWDIAAAKVLSVLRNRASRQ